MSMFNHLLVPTDGSELSNRAVSRAIQFAQEAKARLSFLYVQSSYPLPMIGEGAYINPLSPEEFADMTRAEAAHILDAAVKQAHAVGVAAGKETCVSELPYDAIIKTAEQCQCDLIFMASHGRRGLAALLLGSETQKVLTHSKIPVLIYR